MKTSLKKYISHFIKRIRKGFYCDRELGTEQNCNILTPTLMAISVVSFSFSRAAQPEARGPSSLLDDGFLYRILSLTLLISNSIRVPKGTFCGVVASPTTSFSNSSILQLPDFLFTPSYIIVQSPTQSLEWHVWSSSSGNNSHAVHRSLSSGASVYECTMRFLPCPIFSGKPTYAISSHNCHRMCHFFPVHHFGMACLAGSKVNIQHLFIMYNSVRIILFRNFQIPFCF